MKKFIFFILVCFVYGARLFGQTTADRYIDAGNRVVQTGDLDTAIDYYNKALKLEPGRADAYNGIGRCLYTKGDYEGAEEKFLLVLKVQPENYDTLLLLGDTYLKLNDLDSSILTYKKLVDLQPNNKDPYIRLGRVYVSKNMYKEALALFKIAKEIDPNDAEANDNFSKLTQIVNGEKVEPVPTSTPKKEKKQHFQTPTPEEVKAEPTNLPTPIKNPLINIVKLKPTTTDKQDFKISLLAGSNSITPSPTPINSNQYMETNNIFRILILLIILLIGFLIYWFWFLSDERKNSFFNIRFEIPGISIFFKKERRPSPRKTLGQIENKKKIDSIEPNGASDRPLNSKDPASRHLSLYAQALSEFILNKQTKPPLTFAVIGEWGKGKTSLMNLTKKMLEDGNFNTVWFNAWHHQEDSNMVASLFETLRDDALPKLPTWDGIFFRIKLLWNRTKKIILFVSLFMFSLYLVGLRPSSWTV